ncbi:NEL-type E3 ubiquitin ligase domain-containing protein [Pseudomonas gorinensis]
MAHSQTPLPPGDQGQHYATLVSLIPQALVKASPPQRTALRAIDPKLPAWYTSATQQQKDALKTYVDASWTSLVQWETQMAKIQTVVAFAKPLLEAALKRAGHVLDVEQTYLRLYVPVEDAFGRPTGGFRSKTFSVLQAALNNFEEPETAVGFFNNVSGFITRPDDTFGHFERAPTLLAIDAFARICRDLDLGGQYQTYLKTHVRLSDVVSQALLRDRYITWQKGALKAAAHLALLKGDIGADDFALLLKVAAGEKNIQVDGKPVWYHTPCLMHLRLQGCLLIEPCAVHRYGTWFIAWIPDDPVQPIKRYESFIDFRKEMTTRLTAGSQDDDRSKGFTATHYQTFFSRFVARKDRPYYFRRLTELVTDAPNQPWTVRWMRSERGQFWTSVLAPSPFTGVLGDPAHSLRVPANQPNLDIHSDPIKGAWLEVDLWDELYENLCTRVLDDGFSEAIPTAQADAANHARRLSHYLSLGMLVVNTVSMVVPPLGYAMLAVTTGQLLYEVFEGVHELSVGEREAAWSHLGDVLENLAMLTAAAPVFHFTVSPFVESLKLVKLPSGKTRLWKPDLTPYVRNIKISPDSVPSAEGLHSYGSDKILVLEGKPLELKKDPYPGKYRIQHPRRPDAYQPEINYNGSGAWVDEVAQPRSWLPSRLMRRLGPSMEGFNDSELERIRTVSDIDNDVLRRVHTESEAAPAILMDTARQFQAYADAVKVSELIGSGELSTPKAQYALPLIVELPGWPASWAIELVPEGTAATPVRYGAQLTSPEQVLTLRLEEIKAGKLFERVAQALSKEQMAQILRHFFQYIPEDVVRRTELFQSALADFSVRERARLFKTLYADQVLPADQSLQVLLRDFTGLPSSMGRQLLNAAPAAELATLKSSGKVPFKLALQARHMQRQMRLVRAYEGLYLDALANPDTEALVLNTLEKLPGWKDDLRLEVREINYDGLLRASVGPVDAANRKVLVWVSQGRYQAFDEEANSLHSIDNLHGSIQHALTDAHRTALGLPHVGQGQQLKGLIQQYVLSRPQLRKVLHMVPDSRPFFLPPSALPGNRRGYPLSGRGVGLSTWDQIVKERLQTLYPDFTDGEITALRTANDPNNDAWLKALEREYKVLDATLQTWMATPIDGGGAFGSPAYREQLQIRSAIARVLKDAWRRIGPRHLDVTGRYLGQSIDLESTQISQQLQSLPALSANFDHVTWLNVSGSDFNDTSVPFLSNFPELLGLNLELCELTQLPSAITQMSSLQELDLSDNEIVLDADAVGRLKSMRHLRLLGLNGNPLGLAPDISQMRNLRLLWLASSGQTGWPEGLFEVPRERSFMLDLSANRLDRIPDVVPGSEHAGVLARTVVERDLLTPQVWSTLKGYIESVGLDPERRFPPRGTQDSAHWMEGLTAEEWQAKQPAWDALEHAKGSEPFFAAIREVSESSDSYTPEYRAELTAKVWRMLEAADAEPKLRDKLFLMATAPTTCVDAGAQLFNAMGVEVMQWEAYASNRPEWIKVELLDLAKGKSRLDEVGRIAHGRVAELIANGRHYLEYDGQGQPIQRFDENGELIKPVDETGIHLGYTLGLARRLDLPWQSRSMRYPDNEDVPPELLDKAAERVLSLEEGDLLREQVLEQDFWRNYLEAANPEAFEVVINKSAALDDLLEAQKAWAANGHLTATQKAVLRKDIDMAGRALGKPSSEIRPGQVMTDEQYYADILILDEERKTILRRLCDQAMGRAASVA